MTECEDCNATEDLQEHHTSYDPESTVKLCVECHMKRHGNTHGVGLPKGTTSHLRNPKQEIFRETAEIKERGNSVSIVIPKRWARKMGVKKPGSKIERAILTDGENMFFGTWKKGEQPELEQVEQK